ncbi:LuxR family transcriptional regulator [Nonomuraea sp. C10]|uniref:helix-turn-helix transcriptional regulator n=1 Tax=Nonomuraea sp. C10 TaxID=2600577 RepID=UPI0011CE2836|nr:LuxR family transcriptional regulator [Nonomuraea sp. C10]TXK43377.1 helix-turn-helix transcriptional regulator [Nonomuraea sp. C10]
MNGPRQHDVFVDRGAHLQVLRQALRDAQPGRRNLAVVSGPPGIGKTALAERFAATAPDARVLRAAGAETEATLPYALLAQLLGAGVRAGPPPVAALLDELAGAGDEPVLLIVDDVQWGDPASLETIARALRRPRPVRLLVIMIVRDPAAPSIPESTRRLFDTDGTVRVPLPGLDTEAVAELCESLRGRRPARWAASRLRAHTGGNPLHVRTLLAQVPAGVLDDPGVDLPAPYPVTARVLAASRACGTAGEALVAGAAVLGDRCSLHAAAEVAEVADPLIALEEAIGAGLLREEIGTGQITFPDTLVRAAVYQARLGPSRRAALHRRAAELVQDSSERLRHRAAGTVGPDGRLAAELAAAGRRRAACGALLDGTRHLTDAARLAASAADRERYALEAAECRIIVGDGDASVLPPGVTGGQVSPWRAYLLALLRLNAGRTDEAETLLDQAWTATETDPAQATTEADAALADATNTHPARATTGAESARATTGADPVRVTTGADAALAAKVAGQRALLCLVRENSRSALTWSAGALGGSAGPVALDFVRCVSAQAMCLAGREHEALRELARLPAASGWELESLVGRATVRLRLDDLPGALRDLENVLAADDPLPLRMRLLAHSTLAEVGYHRGDWDRALADGAHAAGLARDAGHVLLAPICHVAQVLVHAARGAWQDAETHLRAMTGDGRGGDLFRGYAAAAAMHVAAARGDAEAVADTPPPGHDLLPWADLLVEALVTLGRPHEAESRLVAAESQATTASALAALARARGGLHAARRETGPSIAAFERALELLRGLDRPFDRARAELGYGACLRRMGKRAAAAAHLRRARATLAELGAEPHLERCERELAACGVGGPARTAPSRPGQLTTQELAVARHAAQGLTNRQIARELVVSVKTVEYHLSHIYPKMQVRSRAQLAARFAGG